MSARTLSALALALLLGACDGSPTGPGGSAPRSYTVVALSPPAGATVNELLFPVAINDNGQVALYHYNGGRYLALWSDAGFTTLPTPAPAQATALNDAGQVAGYTTVTASNRSVIEQRPILGEAGRTWYLAGTGLGRARALGLNDAGTVVGAATRSGRTSAFVVSGGQVTFVDIPGDTAAEAVAVNASGHVAINGVRPAIGASGFPSAQIRAYLWRGGEPTSLGALSWNPAGAGQVADVGRFDHVIVDLNDRDEAVGYSTGFVCAADGKSCFNRYRAFLWRNGKMTDLGKEYEGGNSIPRAVNARGQVLVEVRTGSGEVLPMLWSGGRLHDLNEALAGTGWKLSVVVDLNDRGQILGMASRGGTGAIVRLDPV